MIDLKEYDKNQMMSQETATEMVFDFIVSKEWYVLVDPNIPGFNVADRMAYIEKKYYWNHGEDFKIVFHPSSWAIFMFKKTRITDDELNAVIEGGNRADYQDVILPIPKDYNKMAPTHVDFILACDAILTARGMN